MKIELPEWTEGKNIYVFAGIELVALKSVERPVLSVKEVRCNMCGKCCMNLPDNWKHGVVGSNCQHLSFDGNDYLCKLGKSRPFACSASDDSEKEFCCVTWKEV